MKSVGEVEQDSEQHGHDRGDEDDIHDQSVSEGPLAWAFTGACSVN